MTDHDKMLALLQKLGVVEFKSEGRRCRLFAPSKNGLMWGVKYSWQGTWVSKKNRHPHEALCLLIHAALEALREKWTVQITLAEGKVVVALYRSDAECTYEGPTLLDALLAAANEEL